MSATTVKVEELGLGDVVQLSFAEYGTATVYRVNPDGSRQVWRPYVHTSGFSYTGGVIPSIGIEDFSLRPGTTITLLRKAPEPQ